ncbi:hypothetical protein EAH72_33985 [Pseudomonas caspiana]|nr:hypothetical protein EAH72_33985 [Pseudomonas caspiana]
MAEQEVPVGMRVTAVKANRARQESWIVQVDLVLAVMVVMGVLPEVVVTVVQEVRRVIHTFR